MFPLIVTPHILPSSIPIPFLPLTKHSPLFHHCLLHNQNRLKTRILAIPMFRSISTSCGPWRCCPAMLTMIRSLHLPKPWIKYLLDSPIPLLLASQSTPPARSTFYQSWPAWRLDPIPPLNSVQSTFLAHSSLSTSASSIPPLFTLPRAS